MNYWRLYNSIEIWVWVACGVAFFLASFTKSGLQRKRCYLAALAFILFGISDAVELRTGSWWKPWWLFAWKAACVILLLMLYLENLRSRLRQHAARRETGDG